MKRIQRKRSKGWRMPENTVYVGRPSRWGNPYRVIEGKNECFSVVHVSRELSLLIAVAIPKEMAIELAVKKFKEALGTADIEKIKKELVGKNLACFCPASQPCHADVLLQIANS